MAVDVRRRSTGYLRHFGGIQFLRIAEAEHASTRSHSTRIGKQIDGVTNQPTMDEEVVPLGHDVQVVDPDVRNYVYGLVTAVSDLYFHIFVDL